MCSLTLKDRDSRPWLKITIVLLTTFEALIQSVCFKKSHKDSRLFSGITFVSVGHSEAP